jgi:hypothetical protein
MKPDEYERLQEYFWKLESLIPNPPRGWEKNAKPCKWLKILEEQRISNGGKEKTSGPLRQHPRKARKD